MKKYISFLMVVILAFSCLSITVFAGEIDVATAAVVSGDFSYSVLPDGTAEIVGYKGTGQEVEIPSTIDGYTVTSIGVEAFGYNLYPEPMEESIAQTKASEKVSITKVVIPSTVTNIGDRAFYYCTRLTEVTIPSSVTYIGDEAFYETPWLESYEDGLVYINNSLYCYKGEMPENTKIDIKNGTIQICGYAFFMYSNLVEVTIPSSVKSIGEFAFYECSGLEKAAIPDSVEYIGYYAFCGCIGLTEVNIPSSLTYIEASSFESCENITEVVIPESVTKIEHSSFRYCKNLSSVTIPDTVKSVGAVAFQDTLWFNNQPDGCVYINNTLYEYKGEMPENTKIVIKDGTTEICSSVFYRETNLVGVTIPSSVTSIGTQAFRYCSNLQFVRIEDTVKTIGVLAFSEGIIIYGTAGSAAEEYAKVPRFDATFVLIGDADKDSIVSVIDATEIQRAVAQISEVKDVNAADFDGDGEVTILDASSIQKYLVNG